MAEVRLEGVTKRWGDFVGVDRIDMTIADNEFLVLLGPSGCGKTTTMRMVAGLEEPTSGAILIGGRRVNDLEPKDRDVAMVFQSYALYPHLTVYENIRFPLKVRGVADADHDAMVMRAAEMVELEDLLHRKPAALSGGQRQRVALARAIVRRPTVFLMDEPLSNLDAKLRGDMRVEIKRIHRTLGATILYVTHDQIEAMTLADRIVLLNGGRIEQIGTPTELYRDPETLFAARFIGSPEINTIPVEVVPEGDSVVASHGERHFRLPGHVLRGPLPEKRSATLAIRPEFLSLEPGGAEAATEGHPVLMCEPTGSETFVVLDFEGAELRLRVPGLHHFEEERPLDVGWALSAAYLFDSETGARL